MGQLGIPSETNNQRREDARETVDLHAVYAGRLNKSLRIRNDGIQVGCTFVSKAALEFIIQKWNDRELYD